MVAESESAAKAMLRSVRLCFIVWVPDDSLEGERPPGFASKPHTMSRLETVFMAGLFRRIWSVPELQFAPVLRFHLQLEDLVVDETRGLVVPVGSQHGVVAGLVAVRGAEVAASARPSVTFSPREASGIVASTT